MATSRSPDETSPLLNHDQDSGKPVSRQGQLPVTSGTAVEPAEDSADLERRDSIDESRDAQFQGLPEIQKRMKYILPAISIGVSV